MKIAWQTVVVAAIALGGYCVGLIAGNEPALGITQPWLTIVVIPTTLAGFILAANQLKSIGAQPANTVTELKTTTITPPPDPPKPVP